MISRIIDPPIKLQLRPDRKSTRRPEQAMINAVPRSGLSKNYEKTKKNN